MRRRGKRKKRNFYNKRASAVAKKLGHNYNKRNPNNYASNKTNNNKIQNNTNNSSKSRKQQLKEKLITKDIIDEEDYSFGFDKHKSGDTKLGWLLNICTTVIPDIDNGEIQSGLDLYFIQENGNTFKSSIIFYPYFYIYCDAIYINPMQNFLNQKYEGLIHDIIVIGKVDLEEKNHLSGIEKRYLKLIFLNETNMRQVCREIMKKIKINKHKRITKEVYGENFGIGNYDINKIHNIDLMSEIIDIREYDVRYITRACIDLNIRVANWFNVEPIKELNGCCKCIYRSDINYRPEIKIFAFDIETEKAPLKFPNAEYDRIMMISYMIDNDGYLIVNREIVSKDIEDFEYTPKPEMPGVFTIFNEINEEQLLIRFFQHIRQERPHCYVHYNGDFFDWPYIEKRAFHYGLDISREIGIFKDSKDDAYVGRFVVNIDCYSWVSRDSYLPQGSQGLKAVTKKKLKYNPVELDPELMLPYAYNKPEELATYSVSDAVATYYLFKKYVQDFIFSLCQIVPMNSGHVLRKGTGTLCEALLMVKAFEKNIIAQNKQQDKGLKFYGGHILDSETYIGGTVEAFESGIFRSDLKYDFNIDANTINKLIDEVPETIKFFVEMEKLKNMSDIDEKSLAECENIIINKLEKLKGEKGDGFYESKPLIYHLDVASMYPNIILTNRLQPVAIVNDEICASCDFNRPGKQCQRFLPWRWRGKYFPASKGEYNQLRAQIEYDTFDKKDIVGVTKKDITYWQRRNFLQNNPDYKFSFADLTKEQQNELLKARIKDYSQKVYKKQSETKEEDRKSCVCQRENGFYVDTVRNFRDRRYYYKGLTREWKATAKKAENVVDESNAQRMAVMYDSIQLAHKCILNSFYGYVMRRGSRWYNMDMAAITTHIGGNIIRDAHKLCNNIGRPLELDTDGIWTLLPCGFPEIFELELKNGNKIEMEYPGSMLNLKTHRKYTNHQHHELINNNATLQYSVRSECSIFFEVDGPYKCMILPASTEEGRKLKKRYCVFNFDGTIEELKGFELKRRGELMMIKIFQQELFSEGSPLLKGNSLQDAYGHIAKVGERWLNILDTNAKEICDSDLFELITDSTNLSKSLEEYGNRKSTAITCAKRLAAFLGNEILCGGKISCKYVISMKPIDSPVSSRAVPVEIFKAETHIMKQYLKKWLKDTSMVDFDIRSILDWAYYRKRIGQNIQKIITIPAAMQDIANPISNLVHPEWLYKQLAIKHDKLKQRKITQFFIGGNKNKNKNKNQNQNKNKNVTDIEDFGRNGQNHNISTLNNTTMLLDDSMLQDSELQDSELQISSITSINTMSDIISEKVSVNADFDTNFNNWLLQSKTLWNQQEEIKKKCKKKRKRGRNVIEDEIFDNNSSNGNKRRRIVNNNNNNAADGYFRLQQRLDELYNNPWQIVEIICLDSFGKFILWIYVNNRLRKVKLNVKREFYINVSKIDDFPKLQSSGKLVCRILPRMRPCLDLIQMQLKADEYEKQKQDISTFLTHPLVEGVYETNVPLLFRIISDLGCCTMVSSSTKMHNSHSTLGFDLKELEFKSTAQQNYLQESKFNMLQLDKMNTNERITRESIKYIYFYHSTTNNSNTNNDIRSIFVFIYQIKRDLYNYYHCHIIVVNPKKKYKLQTPSLKNLIKQMINNFELNHYKNIEIEINIKEIQVKTINKGYNECNKFFNEYKLLLNGPSIILLQTSINKSIVNKIPIIYNFPIIPFKFNELDNRYPSLQWYKFAIQEMIKNWLLIPNQLLYKMEFCRYSHVPIGNMPNDVWSFTSDIFFSRLLSDNKHLWWISSGIRPDLGGLEEDENLFDDEYFNPTINNPGSYNSFCIELEINHLSTNTVLQSEHIQTLELGICNMDAAGGDMRITNNKLNDDLRDKLKDNYVKTNIRIDDTSSCMSSFKILKKLINNWCKDVGNTNTNKNKNKNKNKNNEYADGLLMEFYRWLRNPSNLFYDPLLHQMVHRLMKKVFMQLINSFKKFGSKIIYASFDKIILETGKNKIENAIAYIDSCLNSINKQDLFEWLIINPIHIWECIIWYDHANFGGYLFHEKDEDNNNNNNNLQLDMNTMNMNNFDRELEVRWNIASFLPHFAEDLFDVVFAGYLTDIRNEYRRLLGINNNNTTNNTTNNTLSLFIKKKQKFKKQNDKSEMDASDEDDDQDLFNDQKDMEMEIDNENNKNNDNCNNCIDILSTELCTKFAKYKQNIIEDQISFKVFEYVKQIQIKLPKDTSKPNEKADIFPLRPGSYLKLHDPALEFIKYLCLVLELDSDIKEQVNMLKKNLLRMVDVGEFSLNAKFRNPCMTYILPDVNCNNCKQSKDLDLCRDQFTKPLSLQIDEHNSNNNNNNDNNDNVNQWNIKCSSCNLLYDKDLVESMLLDVVRRRETSYHVQDVICKSCGKAKEDDMSEYCKCSGEFKNKITKKEFEENMEVFYNISLHYGFEYLKNTVEWITRDIVC